MTEIEVDAREIAAVVAEPGERASEPKLLWRRFEATIETRGDKREIGGVVIPYNTVSRVADPPNFEPYDEEILPGAFRASVKAPNRVLLDFEHYGATDDAVGSMGSIAGTLGWGVELEDRPDCLWGWFRIGGHGDGDKALELVYEKVLGGFSAAFKPLRSLRSSSGVMQRARAHLDRVSLCRVGAYETARVMAVRSQVAPAPEPLLPFDPELAAGIASIGLNVPDSLRAS